MQGSTICIDYEVDNYTCIWQVINVCYENTGPRIGPFGAPVVMLNISDIA